MGTKIRWDGVVMLMHNTNMCQSIQFFHDDDEADVVKTVAVEPL